MRRFSLSVLLAFGLLTGCREAGDDVIGLTGTGDLRGEVYLDRDGDGQRTPQLDPPFPRVRIEVVPASGGAAVATVTTDTLGLFLVRNVPVGSYRLHADPATVGDSVRVERVDSAVTTVAVNQTATSVITIGYNTPSIAAIAALPTGTRVGVFATALNAWTTFGDSSVHLADSTGAIRAVMMLPNPIAPGDRVRATATVTQHAGQVALSNVTIVARTPGDLPPPTDTTTAGAARAGGRLDAAFVRIRAGNVLQGSSLPGGDVLFVVDDGSGPLDVLVDGNAGIAAPLPITVGAQLDVTGVLTPRNDGSGRWRLKPRFTGDVNVSYPPITIAAARTRQPGQFVMVHGIALNERLAFADGSVHVADGSGAIRILDSTGLFAPGDSVSVLGQINIGDGVLPILRPATIAVLARRVIPAPVLITSGLAATADGGQRDAALVQINNVVFDTATVSGALRQGFNDGTGFVEVAPPTFFQLPPAGTRVDVTGLLAPVGGGRWVIRPRSAADMVVR